MDILIRGMKMPKNCDECRIMVFEDTNCAPELYCGCPIVFQAHPQGVGHRPDYCPLVPVPPHGRLIDADALVKVLKVKATNPLNQETTPYNWAFAYECLADVVKAMPIIIPEEPAEEGET